MVSSRGKTEAGDGPRPGRSDSQSSQGSGLDEPFRRISRRLREKADRRTEQIETEALEGASDQENEGRPVSRIPAPSKLRGGTSLIDAKTKIPLPTKRRTESKEEPEVVTLSDSGDEEATSKEVEAIFKEAAAEKEETAKEVEKEQEKVPSRRGSTEEEEGTGRPKRAARSRPTTPARQASPARSPGRISRATAAAVRNETKSPAVLEVEEAVEPPPHKTPRAKSASRSRAASQVPETPTRRSSRAASASRTAAAALEIIEQDEELEQPTTAKRSTRTPSRTAAKKDKEEEEEELAAKPRTRSRSVRNTTPARGNDVPATPTRLTRGMRKAGLATPGEEEPAKFEPLPDDIVETAKQQNTDEETTEKAAEPKEATEKSSGQEESGKKALEVEEEADVVSEEYDAVASEDSDSAKETEETEKIDEGVPKIISVGETAQDSESDVIIIDSGEDSITWSSPKKAVPAPVVPAHVEAAEVTTAAAEEEDEVVVEKEVITPKKAVSVYLTGEEEKEKEEEEAVAVTPVSHEASKSEAVLPTPIRQFNEAISDRLISNLFTPAVKKTPVSSRVSALSGVTAVSTPIPGQGNSSFMDWEETGTPKVLVDTPAAKVDPVVIADDFDEDDIQISYQQKEPLSNAAAKKAAKKAKKAGSKESVEEAEKKEEELSLDVTQNDDDDFSDFADMFKKVDQKVAEPGAVDPNRGKDPFDDVEDIYAAHREAPTLPIEEVKAAAEEENVATAKKSEEVVSPSQAVTSSYPSVAASAESDSEATVPPAYAEFLEAHETDKSQEKEAEVAAEPTTQQSPVEVAAELPQEGKKKKKRQSSPQNPIAVAPKAVEEEEIVLPLEESTVVEAAEEELVKMSSDKDRRKSSPKSAEASEVTPTEEVIETPETVPTPAEPAVTTDLPEAVAEPAVTEKTPKKKGKKSIVPSEAFEPMEEISATPEPTIPVSPVTAPSEAIVAEESVETVIDEPVVEKTPKKKKGKKSIVPSEVSEEPMEVSATPELTVSASPVTEPSEAVVEENIEAPVTIEVASHVEEPAVTIADKAQPSGSIESVVEEPVKEKSKKKKGKKSILPSEVSEEAVISASPETTVPASPVAGPTEVLVVEESAKKQKKKKRQSSDLELTEPVEAPEVTPREDVFEAPEAVVSTASPEEVEPDVTVAEEAQPLESTETVVEEPVKEKSKKKKKGKKSIAVSDISFADEATKETEFVEQEQVQEEVVLLEPEPVVEQIAAEPSSSAQEKKKKKKDKKKDRQSVTPSSSESNVAATEDVPQEPAVQVQQAEAEAIPVVEAEAAEPVKEKSKKKDKQKSNAVSEALAAETEAVTATDEEKKSSLLMEQTVASTNFDDEEDVGMEADEAPVVVEEVKPAKKDKKKKKSKLSEPQEVAEVQPVLDVVEANEEAPAKKSKKSKKRKAAEEEENALKKAKIVEEVVAEEEEKENIPESAEEPKKKKKKSKGKKMVVADEDAVEIQADSANGAIQFPDITFKKMFNKPSTCCTEISSALAALYTWSCKQHRADDLPDVFLNDSEETVWQFVAHKNRQINKEYRKFKDLLDEPIVLPGLEDDEDEENLSDLEMDDEEQDGVDMEDEEMAMDEEEGDIDLFNLRDEDLKDLERELHELDDEDDEAGPSSKKEPAEKPKKFKKSIVDDKFFSLAEMDAFCDEQENKNDDEGILSTVDDSWGGPTNYRYEEFFGKLDDVVGGQAPEKKKSKKRKGEDLEIQASKKKKSVRFAMDEGDEGEEEDGEEMEEEPEAEEETPVLLGEKEEDKPESKLKANIRKLKESIRQLEQENLEPRSWELSGEVSAQQRAENTLLDTHMQVDNAAKRAPEVTEDFTERLEALIKQRIKDQAFDDVVRKKKVDEKVDVYRNEAIEEMENMKKSLSEVYEKEYQKAAGQNEAAPAENEQHKAIQAKVDNLFQLIDAMSHYDYTPPQVRPEIKIVSNMAALRVEEVGMMASTDAQLLAPEEIKKRAKGDIKAGEERTSTDKLRERRKKKTKQRAMVMTVGAEKALAGQLENKIKKQKKTADGGKQAKEESMKSSNFFSKLQDTVNKEKKEKTTKKKKVVKSEKVANGGAKFKL